MTERAGRREIWTRLMVDPLAGPLAARLAPHRIVTPNRVTGLAFALGVASATCFATGHLRLGGALFLLRFFCDCLDGMVARIQGSSSATGAALDLAADIAGISLTFAALGWYLSTHDHLPAAAAVGLLAAVVFYNWALAHRKHLADLLGVGTGGSPQDWSVTIPGVRSWLALCRRLHMSAVPWAVEAEIAAAGLAPLLLPPRLVAMVFLAAGAFYVVAGLVNLRRIWRLAARVDRQDAEIVVSS